MNTTSEYNVTFSGDYFSTTVFLQGIDPSDPLTPDADTDENLIGLARNVMVHHYGIDLVAISDDIEINDRQQKEGK